MALKVGLKNLKISKRKTLIHFDFDPLIIGRGKISNGIFHITSANPIDQ